MITFVGFGLCMGPLYRLLYNAVAPCWFAIEPSERCAKPLAKDNLQMSLGWCVGLILVDLLYCLV